MLFVVLGAALLALVVADVWLTVLHPTWRGPLSYAVMRSVWVALRGVARRVDSDALLTAAAPAGMALQFVAWVGAVWLGFALIYLPSIDTFAYSPTVEFEDPGLVEALYVSAVSLTTVGFGDVVAETDGLRLVTVLEAGSGLGVITAAITYLLSVYPLVSGLRRTARTAGTSDPHEALRVVLDGGPAELADMWRGLISIDQDLKRFPILYYFHSTRPAETTVALVSGCTLACLHLRWGLRPDRIRFAELYGSRLQASLERFMEDYAEMFIGGRRSAPELTASLERGDAEERLRRLRAIVAEHAPDAVASGDEPEEFARFVGKAEAFLAHLAEHHRYPRIRLLAPE